MHSNFHLHIPYIVRVCLSGWCDVSSVCSCSVLIQSHFQLPLLASLTMKRGQVSRSFCQYIASPPASLMQCLHMMTHRNWTPYGPRLNCRGLGGDLSPRHVSHRPNGVWTHPCANEPGPQLWVSSPTALWVLQKRKG